MAKKIEESILEISKTCGMEIFPALTPEQKGTVREVETMVKHLEKEDDANGLFGALFPTAAELLDAVVDGNVSASRHPDRSFAASIRYEDGGEARWLNITPKGLPASFRKDAAGFVTDTPSSKELFEEFSRIAQLDPSDIIEGVWDLETAKAVIGEHELALKAAAAVLGLENLLCSIDSPDEIVLGWLKGRHNALIGADPANADIVIHSPLGEACLFNLFSFDARMNGNVTATRAQRK